MPSFSYIFREFIKSMKMLEKRMSQSEEIFHPISSNVIKHKNKENVFKQDDIQIVESKFQAKMTIQGFKPNEVIIKYVNGNVLRVEAKHEDKYDGENCFISKYFVRQFVLPDGYDLKHIQSDFSSDGFLTITIPKAVKAIAFTEPGRCVDNGEGKSKK